MFPIFIIFIHFPLFHPFPPFSSIFHIFIHLFYPTFFSPIVSASACQYIAEDSRANILVVGDLEQLVKVNTDDDDNDDDDDDDSGAQTLVVQDLGQVANVSTAVA